MPNDFRESSTNYLCQQKCGAALAIRIDKESEGKVPCDELCPDVDFDYVRSQALTA